MKRIICVVLVLIFFTSSFGSKIILKAENKETNAEQYIVRIDDSSAYQKLKNTWEKEKKIIVNHKKEDEEFLYDTNSAVVKLTKKEADSIESQKNITIEEDYKVQANNETTNKVESENPVTDINDQSDEEEEALANVSLKAVHIPEQSQTAPEYTNDPLKFKPLRISKNKKSNDELVPWNISYVAGDPSKNKYHGKKIKVAIIDSGIDTHDELHTKSWVDFSDKVHGYKPTDNSGHGTSVAGVIAAQINGIGFKGIASEAELYSVKVLDSENTASVSTIIKALEWCIENKIDIVNMSFGMNQYSSILADEIEKAYNSGILLVSAGGNNVNKIQYPAAYPQVISVGSIDKNFNASNFSDNSQIDLVAPGEDVQTTGYLGSYTISSGTSIATAHVTGVAAAIKSAKRTLTTNQLRDILVRSGIKLKDGSRLVNYQTAITALDNMGNLSTIESKTKNQIKTILSNEKDEYVEGSWYADKWHDGNTTSGHYGIINNMDLSYFSIGASNDTEKIHNRWIVADSNYRTDIIAQLSASGAGNGYRNSSGECATSGTYLYSPYHAKSEYSLDDVLEPLEFLYELARRRLILGSALDMNATNYSGDTYYSVPIDQIMKRRIIVDLNLLYSNLANQYSGTSVNYTKTTSKGYMVLGVFLHLVQDLQAHRAKVVADMLYAKSDGTSYHGYNSMGSTAAESKINAAYVDGMPTNYDKYWALYNAIKSKGAIPIIRLKDFMKNANSIPVSYGGKTYNCNATGAFEDNPYFYRKRFETALGFSQAYINRMKSDTASKSTQIEYYYADDSVPLYASVCKAFY